MPNRLQHETSPYLLQHANNPVDWYPWGEEAFAAARERQVPILLSVGYATCYWCHVMERETFENEEIANQINESFVAIKVDREERPDIDEIYMVATQIMTGRGGWPMNCFLEPDELRPFWCGTYFPEKPRDGMPGFGQVLGGMKNAWDGKRSDVLAQAEQVAEAVREQLGQNRVPVPVADPQIQQAIEQLMRMFDRTHGGFGGAPKFPQPVYMSFLLAAREHVDEGPSRDGIDQAIRFTLDRIAIGGMHDQVGGGFHRYSVDATWTVPHFEKMLYDNAQLALVYARAAKVYDDDYYRRVVRTTLDYVLREMTNPDAPGATGFFSAQDAEVDHKEGLNYLWTLDEFNALLGDEAAWAAEVYGVAQGPNFTDPHHPDEPARSVLRLKDRPDKVAASQRTETEVFLARIDAINAKLLAARSQRKQPITDDKVLAAWNGLMIDALVKGGVLLGEPRYIEAASAAVQFIRSTMHDDEGTLLRAYREGKAHTPAFLEDYGAVLCAMMAVVQALPDDAAEANALIAAATTLADRAHADFADASGVFYDTREDQQDLFVRARAAYDGAMPSGSALMLNGLINLQTSVRSPDLAETAGGLLMGVSADISNSPVSAVHSIEALLRMIAAEDAGLRAQVDRAGAVQVAEPVNPTKSPVQIFASEEAVAVSPESPGVIHVEIRIEPGYHIMAADPGPGGEDLIPLRAGLVSGQGVAVFADYPEGEVYGINDELRIHSGIVSFAIALEHAPGIGVGPGEPVLGITYQVCTDTECLKPSTVSLDVPITIKDN